MRLLKRLWEEESAMSAAEYGILAGVVVAALIGLLVTFRDKIKKLFTKANESIPNE